MKLSRSVCLLTLLSLCCAESEALEGRLAEVVKIVDRSEPIYHVGKAEKRPVIDAGPGIQQGVTADSPATLHDLTPTFLDYAQAKPLPDADAISLRPILEGWTTRHRQHVTAGLQDWRMVFDGRYKLTVNKGLPHYSTTSTPTH